MSMTVKELREALAELPDDMPVILQKDSEGNGYSPLAGADGEDSFYVEQSTQSGTVVHASEGLDGCPCLVLWPIN